MNHSSVVELSMEISYNGDGSYTLCSVKGAEGENEQVCTYVCNCGCVWMYVL